MNRLGAYNFMFGLCVLVAVGLSLLLAKEAARAPRRHAVLFPTPDDVAVLAADWVH